MSVDNLKSALPEYAKDLKLNLGSITRSTVLNEEQLWGTLLASAAATRNTQVLAEIGAEAADFLSAEAYQAALGAASIMGMNNVYYRFLHLVEDAEYQRLPARLRMNALATPGIGRADFELLSLAVSAINACGLCIISHERKLREEGMDRQAIQSAVRIAAVMHAVAGVLSYGGGSGEPEVAI